MKKKMTLLTLGAALIAVPVLAAPGGDRNMGDANKDGVLTRAEAEAHAKAMFVKLRAERAINTFAVVKDGRWFERGKMGWFASVHDEKDPETWASVWNSLVRNVDPDTLITIVDCHI